MFNNYDKYTYEMNKFLETIDGRDIVSVNVTSSSETRKDVVYIFYKDYSKME
jgi:predicted permease